jgi:hypothetical protein
VADATIRTVAAVIADERGPDELEVAPLSRRHILPAYLNWRTAA